MDELIRTMVQYAPAVVVLVWVVWRYDSRQQDLVDRIVELTRRCMDDDLRTDKSGGE